MKLIRVIYGKKNTPENDREYHLEGETTVGTVEEFETVFPGTKFEIIDEVQ